MELDLTLRVRVHYLEQWIKQAGIEGVVETSPGVRSLMIEYDVRLLPLAKLLEALDRAEAELPDVKNAVLPSRILHLPMAFEESKSLEAIGKYMRSIRHDAPYLPSNIDYIATNNGIVDNGKAEVASTIFSASYIVLGLGDVYLGAPCAVPLDPRHRLVTTKYNPARTFTAEGTVGIGGSYMCVYPMGKDLIHTRQILSTLTRVPSLPRFPGWLSAGGEDAADLEHLWPIKPLPSRSSLALGVFRPGQILQGERVRVGRCKDQVCHRAL